MPPPPDRPDPADPLPPAAMTRRAALGAAGIAAVRPDAVAGQGMADPALSSFRQAGTGAIARSIDDKLRDIVSVRDFGARGDGRTDDTAAIQAAFSSGAGKVVFPPGRYITGPLTLPDWLHIQGEAYQPGIGGDGRTTELRFHLGTGAGLTCGLCPVISNLFLQNTGGRFDEASGMLSGTTARAVSLRENALIEDCCFSSWDECIRTGRSTYYLKTSRLHFNRCRTGYRAASETPYNIHVDAPHSVLTDRFIAGAPGCAPRNVKVFGGSIEGFGIVASHVSEIAFFGTYFETDAPHRDVAAIAPGIDRASVALFGCLVFMNRIARFVDMAGLDGAALTSIGNVYDGIGQAGGICLFLPASGSATLSGDRFGNRHPPDCLYVDSIAAAGRFDVTFPALPDRHAQAAYGMVRMIGPRGFVMNALAAAPAARPDGMTVMADGVRWDPLARNAGRPYWTVWQGDRWGMLSG